MHDFPFSEMYKYLPFSELKGKILTQITHESDGHLRFYTTQGKIYSLGHEQDCCEHVYLKDICGDLDDLLNSEILFAEEVSSDWDGDDDDDDDDEDGYYRWYFYKLSTMKGDVTLRWYGASNGDYSISVDFTRIS